MKTFIKETRDELNKVFFPSKNEIITNFKMVLGFTMILTVFLGLLDLSINNILQLVLN